MIFWMKLLIRMIFIVLHEDIYLQIKENVQNINLPRKDWQNGDIIKIEINTKNESIRFKQNNPEYRNAFKKK